MLQIIYNIHIHVIYIYIYNLLNLKVTELHTADFAADVGRGGVLKVSYYPGISSLILFSKNVYILHFSNTFWIRNPIKDINKLEFTHILGFSESISIRTQSAYA